MRPCRQRPRPARPSDPVQLWIARVPRLAPRLAELAATLDPDELARAAAYRDEGARRRFVAGRGLLRAILGRHLGLPADRVVLTVDDHGKPALARPAGGPQFNVGHAGDLVCCAVGGERPVGVDLEPLRWRPELRLVADLVLSPREREAVERLPAAHRQQALIRAWTRKEACGKAVGRGLALPLRRIETGLSGPATDVLVPRGDGMPVRLSLVEADVAPGYAGALAAAGAAGLQVVLRPVGAERLTALLDAGAAGRRR